MITSFRKAARGLILAATPAVFFSQIALAGDPQLRLLESSINDLILDLSRSVVTIEASEKAPRRLGGPSDQTYATVVSSGIVVDSMGHILVAARSVVGKDQVVVRFDDHSEVARLAAVDYQTELALLECRSGAAEPAVLSEREACGGQMVVAMGHAYGVRAAPSLGFCAGLRAEGVMQFSVHSASTEVGGGVFDLSGRLLGVIIGQLGSDDAVTLAVPASQLTAIIDHLRTHGDRHSGFAGITTQEIEILPPLPVERTVIPASLGAEPRRAVDRGLLITAIVPASPAERAGLAVGDLIFAVNGMPVNSAVGLAGLVRQSLPGTRLELELLRHQRYQEVGLLVGRKSLTLSEPDNLRPGQAPDSLEIDSMRRLIQTLKEELQRLERRINLLD